MKSMKSFCIFIIISQKLRHRLQICFFFFQNFTKKPKLECGLMINLGFGMSVDDDWRIDSYFSVNSRAKRCANSNLVVFPVMYWMILILLMSTLDQTGQSVGSYRQ